jgi:hypothetical protein
MPGIDRRAFGIQAKRHITLLTLPTGCHSNRDFTRQVIIEDVLDRKRDLFLSQPAGYFGIDLGFATSRRLGQWRCPAERGVHREPEPF